ncbi:MAG TPA: integrase arm-type DNA-binding domain-containing protein [Sphingomonadaceae bacterium]|nr:integrase arm-type DNA-binding domain-containing protein [Sphingomonadaceae bacterium]
MPKKVSNALTPLQVKQAKKGRYIDGGGLHLVVKESGSRSWVFRYTIRGGSREIGLGPAAGLDMVSLADARDLAIDLRRLVKGGVDPLQRREEDAAKLAAAAQTAKIASITFRDAAETYIAAHEGSWRNDKHRQQWKNTLLTFVYPVMGDIPVAEVSTEHVMAVLEPIWSEKSETASRVRGRIETILDAAKARGFRQGENPARWRGHIAQILPARQRLTRGHHPALPYERVPQFVQALRKREAMAALALEFIILTAARTGEALHATWQEIDIDKGIWTVPALRMKAGKEHRVPLSPRAVDILKEVRPLKGKYVFLGAEGGALSNTALANLIRRMHNADLAAGGEGYSDQKQKRIATAHGFRSAVRDWADERTSFPHEMKELMLAHTIANKAEAAYRRGDMFEKRRRMMTDWAKFCEMSAAYGEKVTPINVQVA